MQCFKLEGTGQDPSQPSTQAPQTEQPQVEQPKVQPPKPSSQSFHIDTVINTWGEPKETRVDANGSNVYVWENCKPTGNMIEKCDSNGCKTIPETTCCERALVTDEFGYVQNLKEAVNNCI